jgi:cytoskeletal protein CcmA (bactofilin family)
LAEIRVRCSSERQTTDNFVSHRRFSQSFLARSRGLPHESHGTTLAIAGASNKGAPMQTASLIGPSITITGDIAADEPLTIAGRVNGTVSIPGHSLTILDAGIVNADVQADAVIVSGQVNGSLVATTRIAIGATAVIDGDLCAPVVKVEEGAELRGKLDIEGTKNTAGLKLAS